jgi:histidinol-phosphatase (PHP family)
LIDCHVHTASCGHATGEVPEYVAAAVDQELAGIVFTEHLPLPSDLDPRRSVSPSPEAFARYAREVRSAADGASLEIVLGGEADWLPQRPDFAERARATARELGVRVLLGSVHFIGHWAFDDPNILDEWRDHDIDEAWTEYFTLWCEAARSGAFDVMAHPDLVKKFGHRPTYAPSDLYAEAARAAADAGVCIEVSTAGLRKPIGEIYPGPELLAAFCVAGVPATIGSDAHAPEDVGYRLDAGVAALQAAGYSRIALPLGHGEVRWFEL